RRPALTRHLARKQNKPFGVPPPILALSPGGGLPRPRRSAVTASQPDEEALFNAARRIGAAAAREQYLREATGGDDAVRRRVEALLSVNDAPDSLLDRPVVAAGAAGAFAPTPGGAPAASP